MRKIIKIIRLNKIVEPINYLWHLVSKIVMNHDRVQDSVNIERVQATMAFIIYKNVHIGTA